MPALAVGAGWLLTRPAWLALLPAGPLGYCPSVSVALPGHWRRAWSLLHSTDFFDSGNNPDITFTADGIRPSGWGVAVTGALTVRDRSRPLSKDSSGRPRLLLADAGGHLSLVRLAS